MFVYRNRLKEIKTKKFKHLSDKQFSELLEISPSSLSEYFKQAHQPGIEKLPIFAKKLKMKDWTKLIEMVEKSA